jgi:hypothetical protein
MRAFPTEEHSGRMDAKGWETPSDFDSSPVLDNAFPLTRGGGLGSREKDQGASPRSFSTRSTRGDEEAAASLVRATAHKSS